MSGLVALLRKWAAVADSDECQSVAEQYGDRGRLGSQAFSVGRQGVVALIVGDRRAEVSERRLRQALARCCCRGRHPSEDATRGSVRHGLFGATRGCLFGGAARTVGRTRAAGRRLRRPLTS